MWGKSKLSIPPMPVEDHARLRRLERAFRHGCFSSAAELDAAIEAELNVDGQGLGKKAELEQYSGLRIHGKLRGVERGLGGKT